jgi:hypothetical protein
METAITGKDKTSATFKMRPIGLPPAPREG